MTNQLTNAIAQLTAAAEALESVEASESDDHDQYCLDMLRGRIAAQIKIARKYPEHTIQYWDNPHGFVDKLDAIMVDVRYWIDRAAAEAAAEEATEEATEEAVVDTHYFAATAKTWETFETMAAAEKWITAEASAQWHICSVPVSIDTFYLIGQDDNLPQIEGTQIVRESV